MAIPILGGILDEIFGSVKDVVSEVVVDKDKRNQINADLQRMQLEYRDKAEQRVHEQLISQTEINKVEAGHSSIFVAGWRPAAGWASVAGLVYATLLEPLSSWSARVVFKYSGPFPEIDPTLLIFVLGGMLGIGAMRSYEKVRGVSTDVIADNAAASRNVPHRRTDGIPVEQINMDPKTGRIRTPENAPWHK